jgi:PhoH-like ATPase
MRVKASAVGLRAEEYRAELAVDSGWTGLDSLDIDEAQMARLWESESLELADLPTAQDADLPCHTGLVLHSSRGSALVSWSESRRRNGWSKPFETPTVPKVCG